MSIDTVRYYERRRLLPNAPRTANGYRVFTTDAIDRVLFIKQAQELGFSLNDISTLMTSGTADCSRVHELLDAKLTEINERLGSMLKFRERLIQYLAACEAELKARPDSAECPLVVEISHAQQN